MSSLANSDQERAREDGRGRQADKPTEMPAKGWKDILLRTLKEVGEDRIMLISAGVTYFLLLALFPALTAFISIYGLFAEPSTVADHMQSLSTVVPAGGLAIINEQVQRVTAQGAPTLGFALLISLGLALWSASSGIKSLFEEMNVAYDETEKRNFFVLNATALLFTLAGLVAAVVMLGVVVALPAILSVIGLSGVWEWIAQIGGYALLVAVLVVGIAALYRWGPSRQQAKWRWVTPGAILAVSVILVVSLLFSWYAANFANFDKTYGSLGALIGFLTWLWITITAISLGAELNSELEHQTASDTTIGADSPMGTRDATMADTLGASTGKADGHGDAEDPRAGKSEEWIAGYDEGRRNAPGAGRGKKMSLGYAIPAALAVRAMEKRQRDGA